MTRPSAVGGPNIAPFPLPGSSRPVVAVPAPGRGPGFWAGAPSAELDEDGTFIVAYRVRNGHGVNDATVVARYIDGERFTTIATLDQTRFGAQALERPALAGRRCPLSRRLTAPRRRFPHLLRGETPGREPRAANGAHRPVAGVGQ